MYLEAVVFLSSGQLCGIEFGLEDLASEISTTAARRMQQRNSFFILEKPNIWGVNSTYEQ